MSLKQRTFQQRSTIQARFRYFEKGLRALRKSLACRMICHLLFILRYLLQQNSPYSILESVRYCRSCGAYNRYGFPSCRDQLVSNVLQAAKAGPAKPVSKRRNNYSGDGYWFPGPNANLPDLRVAVFCLPPTRFFCDNELASLRCCDVSFCDAFVRIYLLRSKTDSL